MEKFIIQGGYSLNGSVTVSGNKNEALPVIAACLLTEDTVVLKNVPYIGDVTILLSILRDMGAEVNEISRNELSICCRQIHHEQIDRAKCETLRAAILLAGPLLARFNHVKLPPPGGDVIGRRRLDTHFLAFQKLGANVNTDGNFNITSNQLTGHDIFLDEPSVTGTENAIMAAVLAKGKTVLRNAACEPHVIGLANMLNAMGAKISGIGTNVLTIEGVKKLAGTTHSIGPDYLEIGSFIVLAAATNSEITIQNINSDDMLPIHTTFSKLNINYTVTGNSLYLPKRQQLEIHPDFAGEIPKIYDGPWPAFPTDLMSILIVAATQAKGAVLFFEKMFDGRMFFVDSLISMGAQIVLCDPHRIVVIGPSQLYSSQMQSPDIRAGMALIIAALCAKGESTIYNIRQIDRGYENLESKLQALGAKIERIVD